MIGAMTGQSGFSGPAGSSMGSNKSVIPRAATRRLQETPLDRSGPGTNNRSRIFSDFDSRLRWTWCPTQSPRFETESLKPQPGLRSQAPRAVRRDLTTDAVSTRVAKPLPSNPDESRQRSAIVRNRARLATI
jgi:hypothetical protein